MTPTALDVESFPIRPGRQAPRVVCVQTRDEAGERVELRDAGLDRLARYLADPQRLIVAHNAAFEVCATIATRPSLLPLWLGALRSDRVTCTYEREKLVRIAQGSLPRYPRNSLLDLVQRYKIAHKFQDGDKDSPDAWRTRYHELDGVPVEAWPEDARRYALADLSVLDVYHAQDALAPAAVLVDQYRQVRGAVWQYMISCWGLRVDPRAVEAFSEQIEAEHEIVRDLLTTGRADALARWCDAWNDAHPDAPEAMSPAWLRVPYSGGLVRPVGSKNTKIAAARMREVCRDRGLSIPVTKTGKDKIKAGELDPSTAGETYTALDADATAATGDPILIAYSRFVSITTLRGRAERLRLAALHGVPIQPRFDNLKETGRTSCSAGELDPGEPVLAIGDQTQNLHRAPGLRECYRARDGMLIWSVDWRAAELHTLAQTCLDLGLDSNMARILNSGRDVHTWFGGVMLGRSYEWMVEALRGDHGGEAKKQAKGARQGAKACDFGFPGGLGIEKFRLFAAKTYQVHYSEAEATERKGMWLEAFPEMRGYFAHIDDLVNSGRPLVHFGSWRYRGSVRYTSAANSYFQGRAADMAKDAGWRLTEEIMSGRLPTRLWNFAHDEFLGECYETAGHSVASRVVEIMEAAGQTWCPGCPVKAEPALQRSWRKGAEPYYDEAGHLRPWEDRPMDEETADKIKKALASGKSPIQVSWAFGFTEERIREAA